MIETIVTLEVQIAVNEGQLNDTLSVVSELGLEAITVSDASGELVECEVVNSKLVEAAQYDENGELVETYASHKPQLSYFPIVNKSFEFDDMLRIENKGDFCIINTNDTVFLYNTSTGESITLESSKLQCIKIEMLEKFPEYIVLKKKIS